MNQRMKDLLSQNLPPEELIRHVVQDCANLAYQLCDDDEEGESLAKQICEAYGI